MTSYKIIFKGEVCENSDRGKIETVLAKFFKIPVAKANKLFNGNAYALKKGIDVDDAIAMQQKLLGIGVITRLIKEETLASDITYQTSEPASMAEESKKPKGETSADTTSEGKAQKKDDISELSRAWQMRFALLEKFSEESSKLSVKERVLMQFNFFALLFGPFYYLFKGMKVKGLLFLSGIMCFHGILLIAETNGSEVKQGLYIISSNFFPMLFANEDYYRHVRYKETIWEKFPKILTKPFITMPALLCSFMFIAFALSYAFSGFSTMYDVSGVWRGDSDGAMVMIDLSNASNKSISVNGNQYLINDINVDENDEIISMQVNGANGSHVTWTLRKFESEDGSFYINLTLPNGVQDTLSFVREL